MSLATMMIGLSIRAIAALNGVVEAAPADENAAAYLVLTNLSGTENRLTGISCDCAERVELHELVTEGTERSMAVRASLAMPPQQLTEIMPGGSRHLMLIGLRRPLVAGEWIEMQFQFEQGRTTERFQVVDDTRIAWGRSIDPVQMRGAMAPLAFLAGSCWRGTFPDGRQTDTHCFSPIYSGSYMQDRHVVLGAPAPYSGVTLYRRDHMSQRVGFTYRASDGSVTNGAVVPIEGGLSFPEVHRAADGTESQIRTTWLRDGPDAYNVRSEMQQQGSGWRTMFNMRMARIGGSTESAP